MVYHSRKQGDDDVAIRIIHRKNGMYDVYDVASGKWIMSRNSADNIFAWLSKQRAVNIDFIDEMSYKGKD